MTLCLIQKNYALTITTSICMSNHLTWISGSESVILKNNNATQENGDVIKKTDRNTFIDDEDF